MATAVLERRGHGLRRSPIPGQRPGQSQWQPLGAQLDTLQSQVSETQQELDRDLVERSAAAVQDVRARVHELREAAKSLADRITGAIVEFAKDPGRTIVDGLLRIVGIPPSSFGSLVDTLGEVGVMMPLDFSVPSIVSLVLDVLGLGWDRVRELLARHIGEENVAHLATRPNYLMGPDITLALRERLHQAYLHPLERETSK